MECRRGLHGDDVSTARAREQKDHHVSIRGYAIVIRVPVGSVAKESSPLS